MSAVFKIEAGPRDYYIVLPHVVSFCVNGPTLIVCMTDDVGAEGIRSFDLGGNDIAEVELSAMERALEAYYSERGSR